MKIFSLSNCMLTFLLGWVFGSIFIFLILTNIHDKIDFTHHKQRFSSFIHHPLPFPSAEGDGLQRESEGSSVLENGLRKRKRKYLRSSSFSASNNNLYSSKHSLPVSTMKPEQLPEFPDLWINDTSSENRVGIIEETESTSREIARNTRKKKRKPFYIYLHWSYSDLLFTVHHLKTFESMLGTFPNAVIRITLIPSLSQYQLLTRYNNNKKRKKIKLSSLFHPLQFSKYTEKLLYDIELIFFSMKDLNLHFEDDTNDDEKSNFLIMKEYLGKYLTKCCESCDILCYYPSTSGTPLSSSSSTSTSAASSLLYPVVPYHVISYLHTLLLYQTGGIFNDFSFYFINSIGKSLLQQVNISVFIDFFFSCLSIHTSFLFSFFTHSSSLSGIFYSFLL
jgi:hypothetical protein